MPSRQTGLPEGTDHIIDTNIDIGDTSGGASGSGGGTSASGTGGTDASASTTGRQGDDKVTGSSAFQFDAKDGSGSSSGSAASGIIGQVKEQLSTLKGEAGERARGYADDGKGRATDFLKTIADIVGDAAGSVEERFGGQYAGVGNRASDSIRSLASTLDKRSVDDLLDDARAFVQRSPAIAIGIAAVVGFAVARVVRSGISDYRGGDDTGSSAGRAGTGATTGTGTGAGNASTR